ncbi:TetR/AcrR family transcriptional regulator [Dactylosporangium sp. NPDC051541]|uniref:TetR/AcrR family transcriptional regulator n=1 Tax=Dactylosporangium sp. NPDC051541 TaxID=3363977 RepID=UPI00378E0AEB
MGVEVGQAGRRERKKAATRALILRAAQELFLERGFDAVSVREIADRADVSPTTVFAHFPQKEALLFFEEVEQRERLVAAVRDRPAGSSISEALKAHYRAEFVAMWSGPDGALRRRIMALMEATPALQDYASRMWTRHEDALAAAITEELGRPEPSDEIRIYARFALQIQLLVTSADDPMLDAGFRLLDQGWSRYHPGPAGVSSGAGQAQDG